MDSLRIVEGHPARLTLSGAMMRNFSLTVVPLREIFAGVDSILGSHDEPEVQIETVMDFAQLRAFSSELVVSDDCIPVFATPGFCNRRWRRRTEDSGSAIEDVTFFVISELWNRKFKTRCFMLHQASLVRESGPVGSTNITTASSSPNSLENDSNYSSLVLRTNQIGGPITITNACTTDFSSYHCISQSGRGVVNLDALYAITFDSFLSGTDKAPLIAIDGQSLTYQDVSLSMDPHGGAICCWAPNETTIRILYFD